MFSLSLIPHMLFCLGFACIAAFHPVHHRMLLSLHETNADVVKNGLLATASSQSAIAGPRAAPNREGSGRSGLSTQPPDTHTPASYMGDYPTPTSSASGNQIGDSSQVKPLSPVAEQGRPIWYMLFGGLVTALLFFLTRIEAVVESIVDRLAQRKKMRVLEYIASQAQPVSAEQILHHSDVRFGLLRRQSLRKLRALCYAMILDGTITYRLQQIRVGDLPPEPKVGYLVK